MTLIDFIIEHRTRLMEETGGAPDLAWWGGLAETWPELHNAAKWATFDQTFKRIGPALKALAESDLEKDRLATENKAATRALHKAGVKLPTKRKIHPLPHIEGWKVQLSPDGYYRAHRRIDGKMYSCYIGKTLDIDDARNKILDRTRRVIKTLNQANKQETQDQKGRT